MIPDFEEHTGNLPPGIHEASWEEFSDRFGYTRHRRELLAGLRAAIDAVAAVGCSRVWVDGSFVTAKEDPQDYDACWEMKGTNWREVDPVIIDLSDARAAQHAKYMGAMWPAHVIPDETPGRTMLDNFQLDKQGRTKGIVLITSISDVP